MVLWTVVGALAGVATVWLVGWQVRIEVAERRERRMELAAKTATPAPGRQAGPASPAGQGTPADQADGVLRVLVVDDQEVVRTGINRMLEGQEGIVVVDEAESVRTAIAAAERCRPDVIVMDVQLPDGSGVEATREILSRDPRIRVLMLTAFDDRDALFSSIMAGASGYVLKRVKNQDLVAAVRTVGAGQDLIDPAVTGALLERLRSGGVAAGGQPPAHDAAAAEPAAPAQPADETDLAQDDRLSHLSHQEARIVSLIADRQTNGEIAARLGLAEKSVRNYVSNILAKLEVR